MQGILNKEEEKNYSIIKLIIMEGTFKNFKSDLDSLKPVVKDKALEIAKKLMKKENLPEKEAIEKAIKRAKEWHYEIEE